MEPKDLLAELMKSTGDNANSLAEKLHKKTTQPQIHKFLKGTSKEPRRATLQPVADFFGINIEAFYNPDLADEVMHELREKDLIATMRSHAESMVTNPVVMVNRRHPAQKPLPGELIAQKMGELTVINAMSILGDALDHADALTRKQIALILEALTLEPGRAVELGQRIEAALDHAVTTAPKPETQTGKPREDTGQEQPYVSRNLPEPYPLEHERRTKNRRG